MIFALVQDFAGVLAAMPPDGTQVIYADSVSGKIRVYDVEQGTTRTLRRHRMVIGCVAISPDGRYLASGSRDHTACLWSLADGRELNSVSCEHPIVANVAFTVDSRRFIARSQNHEDADNIGGDCPARQFQFPEGQDTGKLSFRSGFGGIWFV